MSRHSTFRARTGGRGSRSRSGLRPGPTCSCSRRGSAHCAARTRRLVRRAGAGTGPRDHLLRGLATLVLLALAALAYPRLPAGARAALAAFLGVLAVEGAGLAIADARAVGARGEELQPHYYEALRQPKPIWMIPEAGHTGGLIARPGEYERRVVGFFERTLEDEDTS